MTAIADILDRCERATVRLSVTDGGGNLRYLAPRGLDPLLKTELKANKAEIIRHLAVGDPVQQRLDEMSRDAATGALVHPDWHEVPAGIREVLEGHHNTGGPDPRLPVTAITLVGANRLVTHLPAGAGLPPGTVLWTQPGAPGWRPGPAHALPGGPGC